jgi:SAM-dependent methyltransferase
LTDTPDSASQMTCRVCSGAARFIGHKAGNAVRGPFAIYRCPSCAYVFVGEPCTDYATLYSEAYYRGEGADPLIDYAFEIDHPDKTIRKYEWRGILQAVQALRGKTGPFRWLDYGCGNGSLVRYVKSQGAADILGFDEGAWAPRARAIGLTVLDAAGLEREKESFDVVSAVEVIEHMVDPVKELTRIRALMKPGGLLFYTTGNAAPFRRTVLDWQYLIPDIHVGVFEPETLRALLTGTGFRVEHRGFAPGYEDILRFKILKNLHFTRVGTWERALPWSLLTRAADARYRVTAHPTAWAT